MTCTLTEGDTAGDAPAIATDSDADIDSDAVVDSGNAPVGEAHVHGEDCYTQTDNCKHEHSADCGYTPDSPCTYDTASCTQCDTGDKPAEKVCTCAPVDSGELVHGKDCPLYTAPALSEAVQALIAMVDALPKVADITEDNKEATLPAFEAAAEAYGALSGDDKAAFEATEQYKKLMALQGFLFGMATMAAGDKVEVWRSGKLVGTYPGLENLMIYSCTVLQSGDTVKLLDDVTTRDSNGMTVPINLGDNAVINVDLNGKAVILGYGNLGGVTSGFYTMKTDTLNIKNGKITYKGDVDEDSCTAIQSAGTINIENVDISIRGGTNSETHYEGLLAEGGVINARNCTVDIYTAFKNNDNDAVYVRNNGIVNIVGGEFRSDNVLRIDSGEINLNAQGDKYMILEGYDLFVKGEKFVYVESGTELVKTNQKTDLRKIAYYARSEVLKTFSGKVNTSGVGVANATITAIDANGNTMLEVKSGADGSFTGRLLPGTYTVKITAAGYLDTSDTITVTADDAHKDYTLTTMNRIIVTTTADEAALGNVQVIASKGGTNYTATGSTSPYTVIVPEAGVYTVSVSRGGYISPATQTATFIAANGETQNLAFELTSDFIYDIYTKEDLIKFSNAIIGSTTYKGKTVNLRASIDMRGVNFVPYSGTFAGTFEGNGYMISNLSISGNYKNVGLFPYVNSATIRNLGVVNCNMKSTDSRARIGGIVGITQVRTVIENCYVTGTVGNAVNTDGYSGGIAGWFEGHKLYESRIENCYSNVNLRDNKSKFRDTQLATIVTSGTAATDVTLKNSYFTMTNYGYYIGGNAATVTGVELQTTPATIAEKLNANRISAGKTDVWVPWVQLGAGFPGFGAPEYTCKVGKLEFISLSAAINYALQNSDAAFVTMIADETLNAPITIPAGKSLTLLAEGDCTISRGTATAAEGRMFTISGTGTSLTLGAAGGMGNGNSLTFDGKDVVATGTFFYVEKGGAMTMYDGMKVTGVVRTDTNYAGAIMAYNAGSVLNIAGGEISGNRIEHTSAASAAGVFVYDAILNLSGGKIINNTGAGIGCTPTATINLSGNPIVKGNILSDGKTARNLYLRNIANVKGALADGASIGVSHITHPAGAKPTPFAVGSGYTLADADLTRFTSDINGFELRKNASDQFELFINKQYTLKVNDGTGNGNYSEGETVTITANAPSSGKQFKEWTVSPMVTFTEGTSKTDSTAKFTMPNEAVTAEATYEDIPAGHTHAWATAWTTDTAHHWHECTAVSCPISENSGKNGYAAHAGIWTTDATNHSKICTICSYVMVASTAHVYDDATDTTCNTCGYVRTIAATITGVSVSPTTANVQKGTSQSFSATVSGTGEFDSTITWSVNGGAGTSVSASGVLTVAAGETATTLTVTATSNGDSAKKGTATVTVTRAPVTKYLVSVNDGTGGAEYEPGDTVTITATVPSDKQFKQWTVNSGGVTLANANSASTTFTMPANAVTVTASFEDIPSHTHSYSGTWKYDGSQHWQLCSCGDKGNYASHSGNPCTICGYSYSSGGGSGSTGGGGTTTNDNTITTQPSKPSENNLNPSTEGIIKPPVSVDKDGTVNAPVTDKDIQNAIDKAVEQAKKDGTSANGIAITIDLTGLKTEFNTLPLTLSKAAYQKLVNAEVKSISIRTPQISLALDLETLKTILSNATGDVTINAAKVDKTKLTAAAQKELGNRPAYDLTIKNGGKLIGNFGKGNISIALPYTMATGERAGALALAYVDSADKVQTITQSSYDANSKSLIGRTNHFTVFGIVSKPAPTFTDIKGHWAEQDILFVATRGLLSGTSTTAFSPNTSMTRGMFVTALGRLAGVDTKKYQSTKFTDVAATAYYSSYVAWASANNIVTGTSDTTFSPDKAITRQEMAVMLVNYSKTISYKLPSVHAQVSFTDASSIASWAKDAVGQMQMAGILMGKSGNRFDPTATATRAEASTMLRRFVELEVNI